VWPDDTATHSYDSSLFDDKTRFVSEFTAGDNFDTVWDLGCNTGTFSQIMAAAANGVLSLDCDHECADRLYLRLRDRGERKILPLAMNLANPSSNQGWAGMECMSFDSRNTPELILGLALIQHI
jgi:hypothetical protein